MPKIQVRMVLLFLQLSLLVDGVGCATIDGDLENTTIREYDSAQENFDAGVRAYQSGRYAASILYFEYVQDRFPFSPLTAQASIGVANAHFERREWRDAAEAYKLYVRYYPRHTQRELAMYRSADAQLKALPREFFEGKPVLHKVARALVPVARPIERDQGRFKRALKSFDSYLKQYPKGKFSEGAQEGRLYIRSKLAEHELYVGDFYFERKRFDAAKSRYDYILKNYSETEVSEMARERIEEIVAM